MAFGLEEWGIVLVVVLLLFGATAIPKLARSLGRAQGEFRKARGEMERGIAAGAAEAVAPSDDAVRKSARDLGIDDAGLSVAEVKLRIQQKLS
ncbi:MAG: twin-arginine translocase TatA/TatE family subunit [Thermoplasmatota archaeon]|nr:twin-arginine translocase TatA/TatE family subunit [Halobacteriales archaeon]